jgi:TonB family protein
MSHSRKRPARRNARSCALAFLVAAAPVAVLAAEVEAFNAHPAVRYEVKDRCPQLRETDEVNSVLVLFLVDASGNPSKASVRKPSGVEGLDAAALSCVAKLKFQPATRPGDAVPVTTWQQLQLRWASPPQAAPAATAAPNAAPAAAAPASAVAVAPAAAVAAAAAVAPSAVATTGAASVTTEVHVCADASGTLTQEPRITRSSGDAARDAAAVRIARAGAGNYATAAGKPGCGRLAVTFETP